MDRKVLRKKDGVAKEQTKSTKPTKPGPVGLVWGEVTMPSLPFLTPPTNRPIQWEGPSLITNNGSNDLATLLDHELRCPALVSVDVLASRIKPDGLTLLWPALQAL